MYVSKTLALGITLTGVFALTSSATLQAEDLFSDTKKVKPLYTANFDVGSKRVMSYFLKKGRRCDVTMMVTDRVTKEPEGKEIPRLATAKFKAEIAGGGVATVGFDASAGTVLEYACAPGAQAMSVKALYPVAKTAPAPLYPYRFNQTTLASASIGG